MKARDDCLVEVVGQLRSEGYRVFVLGRHEPPAIAVKGWEVSAVWLLRKCLTNGVGVKKHWQAKVTQEYCRKRGAIYDNHLFFYYKLPRVSEVE